GRPGGARQTSGQGVRRRPTRAVYGRGAGRRPTALRAPVDRRHERRRRALHAMGCDRGGLGGGRSRPQNPSPGDPVRARLVGPDSLGAALELIPGTELLAVNARPLEDFLDWEFLTADDQFVLQARLPSGEEIEYDVERPEGLPMGVMLEPPRIRRCANHCD